MAEPHLLQSQVSANTTPALLSTRRKASGAQEWAGGDKLLRAHDWSRMIKVIVGEGSKAQPFYVYKTLIRSQSRFFEAALSRDWKEMNERVVKLRKSSPEAFKIYLLRLHTRNLSRDKQHNDDDLEEYSPDIVFLNSYTLGDILLAGDFTDAMMDVLIERSEERDWMHQNIAKETFQNTPTSASIRRFLVECAVFRRTKNKFEGSEWWDEEILLEVARAFVRYTAKGMNIDPKDGPSISMAMVSVIERSTI